MARWISSVACSNCGYIDTTIAYADCGRICPSCGRWHVLEFIAYRRRRTGWWIFGKYHLEWHISGGYEITDKSSDTSVKLRDAIARRYPTSKQVPVE